ncbi:MAG TPA: tetratricopeptide repeat protein [Terriglobales bacterium]|nr:tetratricopeptide repeat protein [Terriglobales bacterium]
MPRLDPASTARDPAGSAAPRGPRPSPTGPRRPTVIAALVAIAATLATIAGLGWKAATDPAIPFLHPSRGADWILYPKPGDVRAHPGLELPADFRRDFIVGARAPQSTMLRVRALRRFQATVNGRVALVQSSPSLWRREQRADVAALLHAGVNRIEVTVANASGPPALWCTLDLPGATIRSDSTWEVSWGGATWRKAVREGGPMRGTRFDSGDQVKSSWRALAASGPAILLLAVIVSALLALGARGSRRGRMTAGSSGPLRIALAVAAVMWIALFVNDTRWLPIQTGFDVSFHLDYIRYILENHALPLASRGWEMYQPPLYYALAALVLGAANLSTTAAGAAVALRLLGLVLGLANLVLIAASLRLVFPGRPRLQVLALALAAFLPAQLVLFQLPTNEGLAVTLSSAVVLATLRALSPARPSLAAYAALGLCMGLALLAKLSALLVVLVSAGAILFDPAAHRERRGRALAGAAAAIAIAVLVCGWHYGRVWSRFGTPLLGNWDASAGFAWWQDPGVRSAGDYLRFGRSLARPLYSAFAGVWDGLYSTLWGDGLCSGVNEIWWAPPWCSDLMSAGYLLALIPSAAILAGLVACAIAWIREPHGRGGTLLALALLVGTALLYMTLRIPSYAQAKAIYGLGALLPLCVFGARGLDLALPRGARWTGPGLALAGTWALTAYAALWIGAGSPRARAAPGIDAIQRGEADRGVALLEDLIARDPNDWSARVVLARYLVDHGGSLPQLEAVFTTGAPPRPDIAERHEGLARIAGMRGDLDRALAEARTVVALSPDSPNGYMLEAVALLRRGDPRGAAACWREVLRIDPFDATAHAAIAQLDLVLGDQAEAAVQRSEFLELRKAAP